MKERLKKGFRKELFFCPLLKKTHLRSRCLKVPPSRVDDESQTESVEQSPAAWQNDDEHQLTRSRLQRKSRGLRIWIQMNW